MNFRCPSNAGNCLNSWETIRFLERLLLLGVRPQKMEEYTQFWILFLSLFLNLPTSRLLSRNVKKWIWRATILTDTIFSIAKMRQLGCDNLQWPLKFENFYMFLTMYMSGSVRKPKGKEKNFKNFNISHKLSINVNPSLQYRMQF